MHHKFNLIENANDSLDHAIQHMGPVNKNDTGDWKRIILDIAHVVELLFKETLRRKHPAFIYDNIDRYPLTDAYTVGAEKALKRIKNICGIPLSRDELKAIDTARKKRNEIEHFEFSISEEEAKAIVGQILSFIFSYAEKYLDLEWKAIHLKDGNWSIFRQYTKFYEDMLQKAQEKMDEDGIYAIECTSCHNEVFNIDDGACLVCGHAEEVLSCEFCKEPYIYSSCEFGIGVCPSCEYDDGYATTEFEKY